jgi:uncharacterized paraquat-inducible protein A
MANFSIGTGCLSCNTSRMGDSHRARLLTIFGWGLLVVSYCFLIPGLILPLYYYENQGQRTDKTLWTTIDLVNTTGGWFAAAVVAFFALVVPGVKLILLVIAHMTKKPTLSRIVLIVSKWAIVDAIAASFIMAYFTNAYDGAIISKVDIGFAFFVLYCVLSTVGALIIDSRDVPFSEMYASRKYLLIYEDSIANKTTAGVMVILSFGLAVTSMSLNTLRMGLPNDITSMSVFSACSRLASEIHSDVRPMILILAFVVILPLVEIIFLGAMVRKPTDNTATRCLLRSFPHLGMLDVYAVSVIVMYIFLNRMGSVTLEIPPAGFIVLWLTVACIYATRFVVERYLSRTLGQSSTEKLNVDMQREVSQAVASTV